MEDVVIGVDLGKRMDHSTIIVAEEGRRETDRSMHFHGPGGYCGSKCEPDYEDTFTVRAIRRLPSGTPYWLARRQVVAAVRWLNEKQKLSPGVVVERNGPGESVIEELRRELGGLDCHICAVAVVAGDAAPRSLARTEATVGKMALVSRLVALLESRRIHWPRNEDAELLAEELADFELRVSETPQHVGIKAEARRGAHDDLVIALALAVFEDRLRNQPGTIPLPKSFLSEWA